VTSGQGTCSINECESAIHARGWCRKHYQRWKVHGDPLRSDRMSHGGGCSIDGCEGAVVGRGWCRMHYSRWHKSGSVDRTTLKRGACCSVNGCEGPVTSRGWCGMHYNRWRQESQHDLCSVEGCDAKKRYRQWCNRHYNRFLRYGDPEATTRNGSLDEMPTSMYHLWGSGDRLLYVGITVDIKRRFREHSKFSSWWAEVDRFDVQLFPTRADALSAESAAIQSELPAHNQTHIPRVA